MLTGTQARTAGFVGDGYVICADCAHERLDRGDGEADGLSPVSQYELDEAYPEGLVCDDDSNHEIVEPSEEYCTSHYSWAVWQGGATRRWCEHAVTGERHVDIEVARECSFPGRA